MPARHGHCITHYGSALYLFGGTDALGGVAADMFELRPAGAGR